MIHPGYKKYDEPDYLTQRYTNIIPCVRGGNWTPINVTRFVQKATRAGLKKHTKPHLFKQTEGKTRFKKRCICRNLLPLFTHVKSF